MRSARIVPALMQSAVTLAPVINVFQFHCPLLVRLEARRMPRPEMFTHHIPDTLLSGKPVSGFNGTLLYKLPSSKVSSLYVPTALN